jgi:hypothetical protein
LTEDHPIAVDSSVLGLWEVIPDDGIYYRAYPIKIGGVSCVQLQAIGTKAGPPDKKRKTFTTSPRIDWKILNSKSKY